MLPDVKICGLTEDIALNTAVKAGAAYVGLVFYPPSPRAIEVEAAARLALQVPAHVTVVGLFADPSDDELLGVTQNVPLGMLQLHGNESPARVAELRLLAGLPVMKALRLKTPEQLAAIAPYEDVADQLLFDSRIGNEPSGGPIDWSLLKGRAFRKPWMLAGGLTAQNLAEAVRITGAQAVDVSSGVEDASGRKSPDKIREFMKVVKGV